MKVRNLLLISAASLLIPITSAIAFGQTKPTPDNSSGQQSPCSSNTNQLPPPPPGGQTGVNSLPPWANEINLSNEQKEKLKKLYEQTKKDVEPLFTQLREADQQMRSLLSSDTSSEQLRQQHQKIQALRQQLDNKHFETMLSERKILTSEQRTQLSKLMQSRFPR